MFLVIHSELILGYLLKVPFRLKYRGINITILSTGGRDKSINSMIGSKTLLMNILYTWQFVNLAMHG